MTRLDDGVRLKRAGRVTEANLAIERAKRFCKLHPYKGPARELIVDLRLALEGLLDEVKTK
jgi:hypothetical protein